MARILNRTTVNPRTSSLTRENNRMLILVVRDSGEVPPNILWKFKTMFNQENVFYIPANNPAVIDIVEAFFAKGDEFRIVHTRGAVSRILRVEACDEEEF